MFSLIMIAALALAGALALASPANAANERELYLYYTHTKETIRIVYKRDGRFVQSALNQLNTFLRDWRRNEPANMDPALFDVLWEVYQRVGASEPVHIVSAYRSPATNAMLASNSSGVATNSQHMQGKAIDFFIPGIPVSRIRELGFLMQIGGVGYYPNSGSPFVHLDTGSVRAWPRMTTAQLNQLFPDGRTMHVSSSGQTLPGYQQAKAEWDSCRRVPCNASVPGGGSTQVASGERRNLWDMITGGGGNQSQPTQIASAPAQAPTPAATPAPAAASVPAAPAQRAASQPPAPPVRPADIIAGTMVADAPAQPQNIPFQIVDAQDMITQVASLGDDVDAPLPPSISRSLAEVRATTPSAYAPAGARLEVEPAEIISPTPLARPDFGPAVVAAIDAGVIPSVSTEGVMRPSIAPDGFTATDVNDLDAFASLFEGATMPAETDTASADAAMATAMASLAVPAGELYAPGIETVTDTLLAPDMLSSDRFAFAGGATTTAGEEPMVASGFTRTASVGPQTTAFEPGQTLWVRYDSAAN